MDEHAMTKWIDLMLIPWKNATAPDVVPSLILDAYCVHMMGNIVNCIQSLGIEVIHIPAGCTYLCQLIDVGINKSIKSGMRDKWDDWMIEGDGIVDGATKELSRNWWLNKSWMSTTAFWVKLQGMHGLRGVKKGFISFSKLIYTLFEVVF
jgi:hypothetical protein